MITSSLPLLEADDLSWVSDVLDSVAASRGQPWRAALERIDAIYEQRGATTRASQKRFSAVVGAVQRVIGGRMRHAHLARTCRALVLGRPALSNEERADRIAAAARALNISSQAVEQALWADLPRERPVELPHGRPSELEVAAFANVQLIQSAVRKAQQVTIDIVGDAGPFLRGAAARGLLVSASLAPLPDRGDDSEATANRGDDSEATANRGDRSEARVSAAAAANHGPIVGLDPMAPITHTDARRCVHIEIEGPIALCHRTAVYGRALASLVPLLAECGEWTLTLTSTGYAGDYATQFESPALLPIVPASLAAPSHIVSRLARELRIALAATRAAPPAKKIQPAVLIRRARIRNIVLGPWGAAPAASAAPAMGAAPVASAARAASAAPVAAPALPVSAVATGRPSIDDDPVVLGPSPIAVGDLYLCPDLAVNGTYIEVVGFWTRAYVERKLAAYAEAGLRVVLCVDKLRGCGDDELPSSVVGFTKYIDVDAILGRIKVG